MSAEKRSSDSIQVPFNLKAKNIVEITPNLLNKQDWFVAKFLLNNYKDFNLSLHAIDIGETEEYRTSFLYYYGIPVVTAITIGFGSMMITYLVIYFLSDGFS